MQFLTADFIFSAHTGFIPGGVLVLDGNGTVVDLLDPRKTETLPEAKRFGGVLCPGFINAHCHLELSHLRGQITKQNGFVSFAKELISKRGTFSPEQIAEAIEKAEDEMYRNGIAGVGDISNTADTFAQKRKGKLRYHTFIELLALNPAMATPVYGQGLKLLEEAGGLSASLSPHAPYSVSPQLMKWIAESCARADLPLSMHSQESYEEYQFFKKGAGEMVELYNFLGVDLSFFTPPKTGSLVASLPHLVSDADLLLVHNTCTSRQEIDWAERQHSRLWWCFCPNANLYINLFDYEIPEFNNFAEAGVRCLVGTDSLASNDGLSILDELKVIAENAPKISPEQLLTWATKNGAEALHFDDLGTFEKGKKPGVILLDGYDGANFDWAKTHITRVC